MAKPFDDKWIQKQKETLLNLKTELINRVRSTEEIQSNPDQVVEDGDQAQAYLDQNLHFGLKERDMLRLREIELALAKIEDGSYGICEESDEPIGKKRLEKMPWARYTVEAAEEMERELLKSAV